MKLLMYAEPETGRPRPGVLRGEDVVDVGASFSDLLGVIEGGQRAREVVEVAKETGPSVARCDEVELFAPLIPVQLRDFIAFEAHLQNGLRQAMVRRYGKWFGELLVRSGISRIPRAWYERPLYYKGNRLSVVGHEANIHWPSYADYLDYELELGMVVGRTGRDIRRDKARDFIFGFTIFNDVSARDMQAREMGPGFHLGPAKSKDFDTGNILGPYLVTADEIADPYGLAMTARVNGETWSSGSSADMHWTFEEMLAYVSQSETVHAGEVFGSGTVGTGCGLELGRALALGDTVELEIEGLGVLRNRVVRPPTP